MNTVILFRPVGEQELALIREVDGAVFRRGSPGSQFFYQVANEAYARRFAREWNTRDGEKGFVVRFEVNACILNSYPLQTVGSREHQEYWIPAEDLESLNRQIVGEIQLIATYPDNKKT